MRNIIAVSILLLCSCTNPEIPTPVVTKEKLTYEDLSGTWELQNTYTFETNHLKGEKVQVNYSLEFNVRIFNDPMGLSSSNTCEDVYWNTDSSTVTWISTDERYVHYYTLEKYSFKDSCIGTYTDTSSSWNNVYYYPYVARYAERKEF